MLQMYPTLKVAQHYLCIVIFYIELLQGTYGLCFSPYLVFLESFLTQRKILWLVEEVGSRAIKA